MSKNLGMLKPRPDSLLFVCGFDFDRSSHARHPHSTTPEKHKPSPLSALSHKVLSLSLSLSYHTKERARSAVRSVGKNGDHQFIFFPLLRA